MKTNTRVNVAPIIVLLLAVLVVLTVMASYRTGLLALGLPWWME